MSKVTVSNSSINEARVVLTLLDHVGKENPITSKQLCIETGYPVTSRCNMVTFIRDLVAQRTIPVLSCPKGYYIASSWKELDDYCNRVTAQALEMLEGVENAKQAFRQWHR